MPLLTRPWNSMFFNFILSELCCHTWNRCTKVCKPFQTGMHQCWHHVPRRLSPMTYSCSRSASIKAAARHSGFLIPFLAFVLRWRPMDYGEACNNEIENIPGSSADRERTCVSRSYTFHLFVVTLPSSQLVLRFFWGSLVKHQCLQCLHAMGPC